MGHPAWREGSPELLFGLGELPADAAVPVEVVWRDGAGALRTSRYTLVAGWHTVVLA